MLGGIILGLIELVGIAIIVFCGCWLLIKLLIIIAGSKKAHILQIDKYSDFEEFTASVIDNQQLDCEIIFTNEKCAGAYNISSKIIRLSNDLQDMNVVCVSIFLHEIGHALQDKENSFLIKLRATLINISILCAIAFIVSYIISPPEINATFYFLAAYIIAKLMVMINEADASNKAINILKEYNASSYIIREVRFILVCCFFTYFLESFLSLAKIFILVLLSNKNDDEKEKGEQS